MAVAGVAPTSPATFGHNGTNPPRERRRRTERAIQIAELQVGVGVDQPRQDRDISQMSGACGRTIVNRHDCSAINLDDAMLDRRSADRADDAG